MSTTMSSGHSFKNITRSRLKQVIFDDLPNDKWYVLVADTGAVKVLSSHIRQSELLDYNISVVDPLEKSRKEHTDAVYFVSPVASSIQKIIDDAQRPRPMYDNIWLFTTSKLPDNILNMIKSCSALLSRLRALKEVHTEFSGVDSRSFHTNQPHALATSFGDNINEHAWQIEQHISGLRLATVFTTLRSQPSSIVVRTPTELPEAVGNQYRTRVCKSIGEKVRDNLNNWKMKDSNLFTGPACDLIILDRGSDPVAPLIHPFHYASAVHDIIPLLDHEIYLLKQSGGNSTTIEVAMNEKEAMWTELRHLHLGEAASIASERVTAFNNSKGAQFERGGEGSKNKGSLKSAAAGLPEYLATKQSLQLHTTLIDDIFNQLDKRDLQEVGRLEQGIVFQELKSKDIMSSIQTWNTRRNGGCPTNEDKMRLLLCYLATHPAKLDAASREQWKTVLQLSTQDMHTVSNIKYLGVELQKSKTSALSFVSRKMSKSTARYKNTEQSLLQNDRFRPLLVETIDQMMARKLTRSANFEEVSMSTNDFDAALAPEPDSNTNARSVRTTNRHQPTWHKQGTGSAAAASVETIALGSRVVVVYVVGGFTWSEVQAAHELSQQHGVQIILGGTSIIQNGEEFLKQLALMSSADAAYQVSLQME